MAEVISTLFAGLFIYSFVNLRTVTFENSGSCISVKKAHPLTFKKFVAPEFELPTTSLRHSIIHAGFYFTRVRLDLRSNKENRYIIKIIFLGLSNKQKKELEKSIKLILNKNWQKER